MASSEERMKILKMIEEGKLSAEEGTKLLAALSDKRMPTPPRPPGMPGGRALAAHPCDGYAHGPLEGFGADPAGAGGRGHEDRRAFCAGGRRRGYVQCDGSGALGRDGQNH